mgnify:CR=1 FL=1
MYTMAIESRSRFITALFLFIKKVKISDYFFLIKKITDILFIFHLIASESNLCKSLTNK